MINDNGLERVIMIYFINNPHFLPCNYTKDEYNEYCLMKKIFCL